MKQFESFEEACEFIQNLPYRRNPDKTDINCVLKDNGGTCSTKHAFLKHYADQHNLSSVRLMLGIFLMNGNNTPKISEVLTKYGLSEMPEAHNYLSINDEIHDYTRPGSKPQDFINDLIEEIEIQPDQINNFKIDYHRRFIQTYLDNHPQIPYNLEEFWNIREECIETLQK